MKQTPFLSVCAAGLALGLLAACSPVEDRSDSANGNSDGSGESSTELTESFGEPVSSDVVEGGRLVMALSSEPDTLDATYSGSFYSRFVMNAMCEKLYDTDQNAELVPQLAAGLPELSEDGLTYTLPIRQDATFSDGSPLNAEAVVTSLERHLQEDSNRRSELGPITEVSASDEYTVTIELSEPFAPLPAVLSDRAGMILSPERIDELGADFGSQPSCVGPFVFSNWVPQTSITLEADENYYDADQVNFEEIEYRIIVDSGIRASNLQSGDVQVADNLSTQQVDSLLADDGVNMLASAALGIRSIAFNIGNANGTGNEAGDTGLEISSNTLVRQAFSHAIDRDALMTAAYGGYYTAACDPLTAAPYVGTVDGCPEYDPQRSNELLEEAGVDVPFTLEVSTSNNPDSVRLVQALQAQVADAGFEIVVDSMEEGTMVDNVRNGDYESYLQEWSGRVDPDTNLRQFFTIGGSSNSGVYNNPELEEILVQASQVSDVDERIGLYQGAMDIIYEEVPRVYLFRPRNLTGVADGIEGVQVFPDGVVRLARAGLVE